MRIISIANQKGGCGKTTTAINVSACLSLAKHKTLLIDMDPQGHAAMGLNLRPGEAATTIFQVLANPAGENLPLDEIVIPISEYLSVAPSDIALSIFEQHQSMTSGREYKLKQAIDGLSEHFEYIVIDCPPSLGLLTFNALMASTEILIPIDMGLYSLHGTGRLLEILELVREKTGHVLRFKVVATMYDKRTRLAKEVLQNIREHFGNALCSTVINTNVRLNEAAGHGKSIAEYDRRAQGFADYLSLAEEISAQEIDLSAVQPVLEIPTSPAPDTVRTHFSCRAPEAEMVRVVGSFNDWKPSKAFNMVRRDDGTWSKSVELSPGSHQYKFIVDDQWIIDCNNPNMVENLYGGKNSIIEVP